MTRDEAIDICIEALKEHEDGSEAWFDVFQDVVGLKEEFVNSDTKKFKLIPADKIL